MQEREMALAEAGGDGGVVNAADSGGAAAPVGAGSAGERELATPDRVERWPILWVYAIPIALVHGLALLAVVPWLFDWTAVVACLVGVHLYGQAINIGYHRLLTHRSFTTPRWMERLIVFMALGCLQDTPGRWVATHRCHHVYSDEPEDPHTPRAGFWWSHVGWLLVRNPKIHHITAYQRYARDVMNDPLYMKLEKRPTWPLYVYLLHIVLLAGLGAAIGLMRGEGWGEVGRMAASFAIWAGMLRTVLVWHITWSVNSLTHCFGYKNHETGEDSQNNWLVAIMTAGEGWHNNHHDDPAAACLRQRWWELDVSYLEIWLMSKLGLAKNVVEPRAVRKARRRAKRGET